MKRQVLIVLISALLLTGCSNFFRIIKANKQEEFSMKAEGVQKFDLIDNSIIIKTEINGTELDLLFDTRAPSVFFHNSDNKWVDTLVVISDIGKLISANNEKVHNHVVAIPYAENDLFSITNWLVRVVSWPVLCDFKTGILGQDVFDINKQKLVIDFDKREIRLLRKNQDLSDWTLLKSKFKDGNTTVFIAINGKEYPFGFDTGFSGSLLYKVTDKQDHFIESLPEKHLSYGMLFQFISGKGHDTIVTKRVDRITLGNNVFLDSVNLSLTNKIIGNLVGVKFMKNFNFLIDYENKQMYIQPRKEENVDDPSAMATLGAGVVLHDSSLTIAALNKNGIAELAGIMCTDIIIGVNGRNISDMPFCDKKKAFKDALKLNELNFITLKRDGKMIKKQFEL